MCSSDTFPRTSVLALLLVVFSACAAQQPMPPSRAASAPEKPVTAAAQTTATQGIHGLAVAPQRTNGVIVIGGTLSESGKIPGTGTRVITGRVAPGNSPGCIIDQGNVVFEGSATLEIEIGGATACTQHDKHSVVLSLTLNRPTLNLVLINGFVPSAGQRFDVLNWGTLRGTFAKVNLPPLPPELLWGTAALYTIGELGVIGSGLSSSDGDVPLPGWALGVLRLSLAAALTR